MEGGQCGDREDTRLGCDQIVLNCLMGRGLNKKAASAGHKAGAGINMVGNLLNLLEAATQAGCADLFASPALSRLSDFCTDDNLGGFFCWLHVACGCLWRILAAVG